MILNRHDYYSATYILLEMAKQLKNSYLSIRKVKNTGKASLSRYYLGYSLSLLKQSLDKNNVLNDTSAKLYFDLSIWKDENGLTPMFSFNPKEREIEKDKFNDTYSKYFKGYSFAIDIDSDNINKSLKDSKKIKKFFDEYKLPISIKFSGSRGFHFFIHDKYFPDIKASKKVELFGRMANIIMNVCGLKSHDKGGTFDDSIYDDRRIFKLPYSLNYKNGIEYVCLPLDDEQFDNFRLEDMELLNVMSNVTISNRGLLERNYGLTEKELKRNVTLFLKEIK